MSERRIGRRRGVVREAARSRRGPITADAGHRFVNDIPFYALLDAEAEEAIHDASMRILETIGVDFRGDPEALELWRNAGAQLEGERVRIPRELAMEKLALAPAEFVQHSRNPARSVRIGGRHIVFAPIYGPPYVRDFDLVRRRGTLEDLTTFIKLAYVLPILNHSGGNICEPQDVAVPHRHLDTLYAHIKFSDKPFMGAVTAPERAADSLEMCRLVFGEQFVNDNTVITSLVNGNSPLVWDATMLGAMKAYARHNQAVLVSPFIMQGANTPVTTAGALAQLNAEAVAGMAFAQLVRPGAPVVYGNTLATVSMQSGAPTYGTAEVTVLMLAITQLARRYRVPVRTGGMRTGAKSADAEAGFGSMMSMLPAVLGGVNFVLHAAGFIESALSASFAKLVMDADQLAHILRLARGLEVTDDTLAHEAICEVGPAGHFFNTAHTLEHYESAFYLPMTAETGTYDQWDEEGRPDVEQRALGVAKRLLDEYDPPPLDPSIDEALREYVARRKREIPDTIT